MAMAVSLPNLITIARILMVPLAVWLLINQQMALAFGVFILAGISDAVDGWLAKRFHMKTELGAHLDPLADKLLLISLFVTLAVMGRVPSWLAILVVSRDVLIVGGVVLAWILERPMRMRPRYVSKVNTAAQIVFVGAVLLALASGADETWIILAGAPLVGLLTLASGAQYLHDWLQHMADANAHRGMENANETAANDRDACRKNETGRRMT